MYRPTLAHTFADCKDLMEYVGSKSKAKTSSGREDTTVILENEQRELAMFYFHD